MKNKHIIGCIFLCVFYISTINATEKLYIDSSQKHQKVTGFGGTAFTNTGWDKYIPESMLKKLYGSLGLNIFRGYISTSPYATNGNHKWSAYCNWTGDHNYTNIVDAVKLVKAINPNTIVLASPWSPPAAMKTNNNTIGGSLKTSSHADYANYLNSYLIYMQAQGAAVDIVSIQNEPDLETSYSSCLWTGDEMLSFLKNYGSVVKNATNVKILAAEVCTFNKSRRTNFTDVLLNDAVAEAKLDYVGGHIYGGGIFSYPLAESKGKEVWMTEHFLNNGDNIPMTWDKNLEFASEVNSCMLSNFSTYLYWYLCRYYGLIGDGTYNTQLGEITKQGFVMGQFSRYITGNTRVQADFAAGSELKVSAYIDNANEKLIVVIVNPSRNTSQVEINLPFEVEYIKHSRTTKNINLYETVSKIASSSKPAIELESESVNTFIFSTKEEMADEKTNSEFNNTSNSETTTLLIETEIETIVCKGKIVIQNLPFNAHITLYCVSGQLLHSYSAANSNEFVYETNKKGIYVLSIRNNNMFTSKKIIIN